MLGVTKVISTSFDKAKRLVVKILFRGKLINGAGDVRTPIDASPFGVDSNPVKGKVAIYAKTGSNGKYYVIGYLNTERKAEPGEARIFSTDLDGILQAYVWLKNSGVIEFNGNTDNLVKYTALNAALQAHVNQTNVELAKIATGLNAIVSGSYVMIPTSIDITSAKAVKLKTE